MLGGSERAAFREIQKSLVDDVAFKESIRAGRAMPSRSWRPITAALVAGVAVLILFLIIPGSYGVAVLFAVGASTLGLANRIENREKKRTG
jgi:hypothetical protein